MNEGDEAGRDQMLSAALDHLRSALQLLDHAEAPPQIGARLDQVIHDLYMTAASSVAGSALSHIERNAEAQ